VSRHRDVETYPGLVIFRFDQEIFFANATYFRDQIRHLIATTSPTPRTIVIDGAAISHIDTTGLDMLTELHDELPTEGITLTFARVKGPVRDTFARAALTERFGPHTFHPTIKAAVAAFSQSPDQLERGPVT